MSLSVNVYEDDDDGRVGPLLDIDSPDYGRPETGKWAYLCEADGDWVDPSTGQERFWACTDEKVEGYAYCQFHLEERDERCEICDELFKADDERAEMYDPVTMHEPPISVVCHAQCGLNHGMEIA